MVVKDAERRELKRSQAAARCAFAHGSEDQLVQTRDGVGNPGSEGEICPGAFGGTHDGVSCHKSGVGRCGRLDSFWQNDKV
jgi:hypothetical protein